MARQSPWGAKHGVEADPAGCQVGPPREKICRRAADSRPLSRAQGLRCSRLAVARLDLDEDDQIEAPRHKIDLSHRSPEVAGQNTEPLQTKAPSGPPFGAAAAPQRRLPGLRAVAHR